MLLITMRKVLKQALLTTMEIILEMAIIMHLTITMEVIPKSDLPTMSPTATLMIPKWVSVVMTGVKSSYHHKK